MALRQLSRKLRPGTLAGFWQGQYALSPYMQSQIAGVKSSYEVRVWECTYLMHMIILEQIRSGFNFRDVVYGLVVL